MIKNILRKGFLPKRKTTEENQEACSEKWTLVKLTGLFSGEMKVIKKERTGEAYQTTCRSVLEFTGEQDLEIENISSSFLMQYEAYLHNKGNGLNTISFYMRNLRSIYNKGIKRGYYTAAETNLFSGVFTGVDKTPKRSVNVDSIRRMEKRAGSLLSEKKEKDKNPPDLMCIYFFLFCFYARGMSFIDMAYLKKTNICGSILSYYRHKTGQRIEIKLTKEMMDIIHFFLPMTKSSEYLFPIILDTQMNSRKQYENALRLQNQRLKRVAENCRINQRLSTHVARHSWATLAKKQHVPLAVISEGLGHTSLKTTAIYQDSFEQSVLDRANRKVARAIKRAI